jgi:processive 1,2-diacylglycerol beta-glucosyltransferase
MAPALRGVGVHTIRRPRRDLHNIYWFIAEGFCANAGGSAFPSGGVTSCGFSADFRPNLDVSMHDCLNRGYFQCARETRCDAAAQQPYCGGWSASRFSATGWKKGGSLRRPHRRRLEYALSCGYAGRRAEIFCNLCRREPSANPGRAERAAFRASLHRSERFTVLLAAGGRANNTCACWRSHHSRTQAIAFCGKSVKAARKIAKLKAAHPDYPSLSRFYRKRVPTLLQASDCVRRAAGRTPRRRPSHATPILITSSAE